MTREEVSSFVQHWIDAWNRRDVEQVLSHYSEDAVFYSPKAAQLVGTGKVQGKPALRSYWQTAVSRIQSIRFTLDHFAWDDQLQEVLIMYICELNDARVRSCERMRFSSGLVSDAEGLYGAPV